jgi:hypothetical protein
MDVAGIFCLEIPNDLSTGIATGKFSRRRNLLVGMSSANSIDWLCVQGLLCSPALDKSLGRGNPGE